MSKKGEGIYDMENADHPIKQFIKSNSREIIQTICRRLGNPKCTIKKRRGIHNLFFLTVSFESFGGDVRGGEGRFLI